jgi:arylsulfatase A-like enzyme
MKPNIFLIISHDSGQFFEPYGYRVSTPALDRLADEGVLFDQYYATAPQCSPSRGSILTGLYPHNNGLMGLAHLGFAIDSKHPTIPKVLSTNGYHSVLVGLSHETIGTPPPVADRVFTSGVELGYDEYLPVDGDRSPAVIDQAINRLDVFLQDTDQAQPLYMNIGLFETHLPYDEYAPEADNPKDVEIPEGLPNDQATRSDTALFTGSVHVLDESLGRFYAYLADKGLLDNSIVIFTNDHGAPFPGYKGTLTKEGLGTTLIIRMPKRSDLAGKRSHALLVNIDLFPTLLDLVHIPIPSNLDGQSFAGIFQNQFQDVPGRECFFTELTWHDAYHPMRGIRTPHYSFVKNFADGPKVYMPVDIHLTRTGAEMRSKFYVPNEPEELYDLSTDPFEEHNIVHNPAYQTIYHGLRRRLHQWMIETDDPLLHGPVSGTGSRRWQDEIASGRAYPGREQFYIQHPDYPKVPFTVDWGND